MSDLRAAAQKALKSLLARAERGDGAPETVGEEQVTRDDIIRARGRR